MAAEYSEDRALQELRRLYRAAQRELGRLVLRLAGRGRPSAEPRQVLEEIRATLRTLDEGAIRWSGEYVPAARAAGGAEAEIALRQIQAGVQLTGIDRHSARVVADNLAATLLEANRFAGRQVEDLFRQAGLEAAARRLLTGQRFGTVAADMASDLMGRGITAFVDAAGRRWSLDAYAEMASRTTLREVRFRGLADRLLEAGGDLVYVPPHSPTCPICAPRHDRVYSLTGRTPGYPVLEQFPWHPNCRHPVRPYIARLDPGAEELRERSNRPFDVDPRSAEEVAAYRRSQGLNRLVRERRRVIQQLSTGALPLGRRGEELEARLSAAQNPVARREAGEQLARHRAEVRRRLEERRQVLTERIRELGPQVRRDRLAAAGPGPGNAGGPVISRNKVDILIREIIAGARALTPREIALIRSDLGYAPFSTRPVRAGDRLAGVHYRGRTLGARDWIPSDVQHWLLRVQHDLQWPAGTSHGQFMRSVRAMLRREPVAMFSYHYKGEDILLLITSVLSRYRGPRGQALLGVVYSATYGRIKSVYQDSHVEAFIPKGGVRDVRRHL